jgi:hypothetical protein
MFRAMRDVRRTFQRASTVFRRQGGGPGAWLWFRWKLNWQWALLPLTPFALVIAAQAPIAIVLLVSVLWYSMRGRKAH